MEFQSRSNTLPYPIGLTPFRYPCLVPHVPPPPPGDPHAPGFKPFDPAQLPPSVPRAAGIHHPVLLAHQSSVSSVDPVTEQGPSTGSNQPTQPRNLGINTAATLASELGGNDVEDMTYDSISALLSASQIPLHNGVSVGAYPTSPGERSDGQAGPLTDKMVGRYTMGSKPDCEDCRTGKGGHWGHWVKSDTRFEE
jgi:hypothetical protein